MPKDMQHDRRIRGYKLLLFLEFDDLLSYDNNLKDLVHNLINFNSWFPLTIINSRNSWIIKKSISKEINKTRNKARKKGGNRTRKKIFEKNLKLDNVNDNLSLSKEKVSPIILTASADKSKNNLYTNCIDFG